MREYGCCELPITGPSGHLLGIVTDRDICLALGARNARPSDLKVIDVIQDRVFFCTAGDDVGSALKRMREGRVRYLPVVDEDLRVEGILSIAEVALRAAPTAVAPSGISCSDAVGALQAIYRRRPSDGSVRHVT
jgi:CBS domain-containing protein